MDTIEEKCGEEDIDMNILVDYLRGTRMEKEGSSKTLFEKINKNLEEKIKKEKEKEKKKKNNENNSEKIGKNNEKKNQTKKKPNFYFFLTPEYTGMWKKILPKRLNETLGVQHIKIYLFDEKLIISGANLSKDYFTNRQDRYIEIVDKSLSDFYWQFLCLVGDHSFFLSDGLLVPPSFNPSLQPEKFNSHFSQSVFFLLFFIYFFFFFYFFFYLFLFLFIFF